MPAQTTFFIPRFENDRPEAERIYETLRADTNAQSDGVAHVRRIEHILCRRGGADRTIHVGDDDAIDGQTVIAILQVGRNAFTIHCEDSAVNGDRSSIEIARRTVYAAADFDA